MTIQVELLNAGFYRDFRFRADNSVKILVIEKETPQDVRVTMAGGVSTPSISLPSQNPTLKDIDGGVRVHVQGVV